MSAVPRPIVFADGGSLDFERVRVMGVLNVTPDSFSDGGRWSDVERAVARGLELLAGGADIIDVGGESTRPGSDPVAADEQVRRVVPVIGALIRQAPMRISIDTTSARVAEAALDAGASLVNDISAFRFDPAMLPLIAARRVPSVAMHTVGPPSTMQQEARYDDVVADVCRHLSQRVDVAAELGIAASQIVLDPGLGFGKTLDHNLTLLRHLPTLVALGHPVLVGTSRKSFLGKITGKDVGDRLMATAGSVAVSIALGAHIVRVHDVAELVDAIRVADAIMRA